jgi:hypothetical protein
MGGRGVSITVKSTALQGVTVVLLLEIERRLQSAADPETRDTISWIALTLHETVVSIAWKESGAADADLVGASGKVFLRLRCGADASSEVVLLPLDPTSRAFDTAEAKACVGPP